MGFTEKADSLGGRGFERLKRGGVGQIADLRGVGGLEKRMGVFCHHLQDRVLAMTLPIQLSPKQIHFFQTMTASLKNSTKRFIKQTTSSAGP